MTAPTNSNWPRPFVIPRATTRMVRIAPSSIVSRLSWEKSLLSFTAWSMASRTPLTSSGWVRLRTKPSDGRAVGARSKIRNVSSDQNSSPVTTFQPKLPVWLSFCASAR
ncbi:hypothetical protein SAMN05443254_11440 [Bradyrhizobium sp. OK095]|nr:hypothetical protein SAMN05443254_11440 [Bradyrhizobium sp. OK095]